VPEGAEADDAAHGDVREERVMPEFLACERVRQVELDEGQLHAQQCVPKRHAGVVEPAGIEDRETDAIGLRGLYAVDELVFGVALEGDQLVSKPGRGIPRPLFYTGGGVRAVNLRFALSQEIQVRAVK